MIVTNAPENVARTLGRILGYQDGTRMVIVDVSQLDSVDYDPLTGKASDGEPLVLLLALPEGATKDDELAMRRMLSSRLSMWQSTWMYYGAGGPHIELMNGSFSSDLLGPLTGLAGGISSRLFAVDVRPATSYGHFAVISVVSKVDSDYIKFERGGCTVIVTGRLTADAHVAMYPASTLEAHELLRRTNEQNREAAEASYGNVDVCTQMLTAEELEQIHVLDRLIKWR